MSLQFDKYVFLLLVFFAGQMRFARAQTPPGPTAEQLMQLMRSQPAVNISAPVTATASFDPPVVRPGERAVYRVACNATAVSVNWPAKIPAPPGLNIHLSVSGQTLRVVGGEYQNIAMFDFDVSAGAAGQFTMPEFTMQVYGQPVVVPAARLEVKSDLPAPHEPARQLVVQPYATNVFVGESFNVRALLPATSDGGIQGVSEVQFNGDGFVVDKDSVRQAIRPVMLDGRQINAYIYEASVTPITAGDLTLATQGLTTGMRFAGPIVINGQVTMPGGTPDIILLDSEPVTIHVRPLPTGEELPGFNGLVGSEMIDPPSLATNRLNVGQPAQLNIVIRGRKNLGRIIPPPPPRAEGWQVFPAVRMGIADGPRGLGVRFQYTLIPLTTSVRATPAIPFSCFDPGRGKYIDLTIPALPVTVLAGELAANAGTTLMLSENATEPEQKVGLSKLAAAPGGAAGSLVPLQMRGWFPLVQIIPTLGFAGLWWWDRRRHYLEAHPDLVRRRQARRALRREQRRLEQAAVRGETEPFVQCAIHALRIASAPHYPAAPRALVCGDILQILSASERAGKPGDTVRRFFAVADAATFATNQQDQSALLAEKSALIGVIATLEARL